MSAEHMFDCLYAIDYHQEEVIDVLKSTFKEQIASSRTLRQIVSIRDILRILKKRDVITTSILDAFVKQLPPMIYAEYQRNLQRTHANTAQPPNFASNQIHVNYLDTSLQENIPRAGSNRAHLEIVYNIICDEMGPKHWKPMARHLDFKESKIDTVYIQHNYNTHECVRQVLQYHEENCNPLLWRQTLLNAMDKARRTELRQKVEMKLDEFKIIAPR